MPVDPGTAALCARVIASGEPHTIGNVGDDVHDGGPVAFVGAPLVDSTGHVIGCLCVTDTRPRNWSQHDTELVKELAISATTELELRTARAMAERETRWSEGQQEVLELIAARAPLPETLTRLLHVAESHAPGMLTSILLLERTTRRRRRAAPRRRPEPAATRSRAPSTASRSPTARASAGPPRTAASR